ncbi:MAG: transposase, partial [Lysobacterales bacterium]
MVKDSWDRWVMNRQKPLFASLPEPEEKAAKEVARGRARILEPQRKQLELRAVDLEATLEAEHPARSVWTLVEAMDLSSLYAGIAAVEGHAGRPAIDPRILMALWLYATLGGVGSARAVARLCEQHDAYRWICGGVSVNYHTLASFRVGHVELLD